MRPDLGSGRLGSGRLGASTGVKRRGAGAALVVVLVVATFLGVRSWIVREDLRDFAGWRRLEATAVLSGAVLGAGSHLLLDALMHADMAPFWPFTTANPLLGAVPPVDPPVH